MSRLFVDKEIKYSWVAKQFHSSELNSVRIWVWFFFGFSEFLSFSVSVSFLSVSVLPWAHFSWLLLPVSPQPVWSFFLLAALFLLLVPVLPSCFHLLVVLSSASVVTLLGSLVLVALWIFLLWQNFVRGRFGIKALVGYSCLPCKRILPNGAFFSLTKDKTEDIGAHKQTAAESGCSEGLMKHVQGGNSRF